MWPPGETWWVAWGLKGLTTPETCGSPRRAATILAVVAMVAGASTGPVVWMTTSAVVPAVCGNRAWRMFCTRWGGRVPRREAVLKAAPDALGQHGDGHQPDDPQEEDEAATLVAPRRQPPERALLSRGDGLGTRGPGGTIHHCTFYHTPAPTGTLAARAHARSTDG